MQDSNQSCLGFERSATTTAIVVTLRNTNYCLLTYLFENHVFVLQNTFGLCTLKIIDARTDDAGIYTAKAVNRIGEMSTSAELLVEGITSCCSKHGARQTRKNIACI